MAGTAGTPDRLVRTAGNTESPAPHSSVVDQHYLADHLIPGQLGKGLLGLIEGVGPGHQRFQLSGFEQGPELLFHPRQQSEIGRASCRERERISMVTIWSYTDYAKD